MRIKKLFIVSLAAMILCSSVTTAYAGVKNGIDTKKKTQVEQSDTELFYNTFTGKVKDINISGTSKDMQYISVEDVKGEPAVIIISKETHLVNDGKVAVGSSITCFYDSNAPMIMIYPPQYSAKAVIVNENATANYQPFTGTVKKIKTAENVKGQQILAVENKDKLEANIIVSKETYITGGSLKEGSEITAYYDANAPMIMIYPPQYETKVLIVNNSEADDQNKDLQDAIGKMLDDLIKRLNELIEKLLKLK